MFDSTFVGQGTFDGSSSFALCFLPGGKEELNNLNPERLRNAGDPTAADIDAVTEMYKSMSQNDYQDLLSLRLHMFPETKVTTIDDIIKGDYRHNVTTVLENYVFGNYNPTIPCKVINLRKIQFEEPQFGQTYRTEINLEKFEKQLDSLIDTLCPLKTIYPLFLAPRDQTKEGPLEKKLRTKLGDGWEQTINTAIETKNFKTTFSSKLK
jgi:hypothetical protein